MPISVGHSSLTSRTEYLILVLLHSFRFRAYSLGTLQDFSSFPFKSNFEEMQLLNILITISFLAAIRCLYKIWTIR